MKVVECKNCGSIDLYEENGYQICKYCGTKHLITSDDRPEKASIIELNNDVQRLLRRCKEEPERAKQCAERILEIDPNNIEAKRILSAFQHRNQSNTNSNTGSCYVATAVYGSYDCPQVWTLRRYRDYTLAETRYGRAFIRTYYAISPMLVKWFGKTEWFKNLWKPTLNRIVEKLRQEGVEDTPYHDREW